MVIHYGSVTVQLIERKKELINTQLSNIQLEIKKKNIQFREGQISYRPNLQQISLESQQLSKS